MARVNIINYSMAEVSCLLDLKTGRSEALVYAGIKTATTRTRNRTVPDLKPHFADGQWNDKNIC